MTEEGPYHLRGDVLAIHRAIGHFITAFASVDLSLRNGIARFFAAAENPDRGLDHFQMNASTGLLDILLDRMTAGRLQSAFLIMSSAITDLDEEDREVRDVLGIMLRHFVELRNNIAHATWDVGWTDVETGEAVPPTARVVRVSKDGPRSALLDSLDAETIGREANGLHTLDRSVRAYAESCLHLRSGNEEQRPGIFLKVVQGPIGRIVVPSADN
jgi:hypothetical protein